MATPTPDESPLGFLDRLSPAVAYLSPDKTASRGSESGDPRLIILLTWMDARDGHVAKYIAQHRILFPSSPILIIRSTLKQYMQPSLRRRLFAPALPILQALEADTDVGDKPRFLLHVFSNGGFASAVTLWELWAAALNGKPIPRHAVVMDSCPGYFHWKRNHHVISLGLPFWASPLVWLALGIAWMCYIPWGRTEPQEANALAINTTDRISRETRRAYLYGDADQSVGWEDVEAHGRQAKERGALVRMEKFIGGAHVAQVRVDGERYWRVVKETWEGKDA
ncbi:Transmembrane 53 [Fusarium albosuccineum]|uniref:Transmembrane 53 n=1 Tax=Fusarium albosuccineum TaxID=1237068 RepID=A0A8H4PLJ2_9HYPO|nr:Transmembrane 53 [Fusarium albosuccineum]